MRLGYIEWVGNQSDGATVSDSVKYNWTPNFALVLSEDYNATGFGGVIAMDVMGSDQSKPLGSSAFISNAVESFVTGGITIGTHGAVNFADAGKSYTAIIGQTHPDDCAIVEYSGNGTTQDLDFGFPPDLVYIVGNSATEEPVVWIRRYPSGSFQRINGLASLSNGISTITDGISVGSDDAINESGTSFYALGFKEATGILEVVTITGNATDDRAVASDSGMEAEIVMGKVASASNPWYYMWHTQNMGPSTNLTGRWSDGGTFADFIKSITSTGITIGSGSNVNLSGWNIEYIFMKSGNSQATVVATPQIMALYRMLNE